MNTMNKLTVVRDVVGIVTDIQTPFKAIIQFTFDGKEERALLKKEKFVYEGRQLITDEFTFNETLNIGNSVKFVAHCFDPKNPSAWAGDEVGWFIILGWCVEEEKQLAVSYIAGIVNAPAKVKKLGNKRQGILTYEINDEPYNITFMGSKVFLYGRRLNPKLSLDKQLREEEGVYCDAIPCDPHQNEFGLKWFATAVWRGTKPTADIDKEGPAPTTSESLLRAVRALANNARTAFVFGRGQVMTLLSEEFGVALLLMRHNQWKTVLFHRSVVFIRHVSLGTQNLQKVLREGDQVRIICVSAQDLITSCKFVACQVGLAVEGSD